VCDAPPTAQRARFRALRRRNAPSRKQSFPRQISDANAALAERLFWAVLDHPPRPLSGNLLARGTSGGLKGFARRFSAGSIHVVDSSNHCADRLLPSTGRNIGGGKPLPQAPRTSGTLHSLLPRLSLVESGNKRADSIRAVEVCAGVKPGRRSLSLTAHTFDFVHLGMGSRRWRSLGDPQQGVPLLQGGSPTAKERQTGN